MTKFSIIIPVYNVENYIVDCLESIINQTYGNFEVIIVNDGSKDNSQKIIDEYVMKDKRLKSYVKENEGVSEARNYGISKSKGEYLVFVDSDDTINEGLLEKINEEIEKNKNIDLIKYELQVIDNGKKEVSKNAIFECKSGEEAFCELIDNSLFVTPVTYVYRKNYFIENNYLFEKGRIHEDFGIIPYIVVKAKSVSSLDYVGYNYYVRENSIMTSNSIDKLKKKNEDVLFHYDNLMNKINRDKDISCKTKEVFRSYISNALISRTVLLKDEMLKKYMEELKRRNVGKYLLSDSWLRKMKKVLYKVWPMLYIKLFVK